MEQVKRELEVVLISLDKEIEQLVTLKASGKNTVNRCEWLYQRLEKLQRIKDRCLAPYGAGR